MEGGRKREGGRAERKKGGKREGEEGERSKKKTKQKPGTNRTNRICKEGEREREREKRERGVEVERERELGEREGERERGNPKMNAFQREGKRSNVSERGIRTNVCI